jgi:predicted RNase H-like HicB family nuclease
VPARIIASYGRTAEEAKKMAKEAMGGYVESLIKHGESLPP